MMHMNVVLFGLSLMLLTGCASTREGGYAQPSDFLRDYSAQLRAGDDGGPLRGYTNPAADWPAYRKILLDRVIIWDGFYAKLDKKERVDLQRLADSFYSTLYERLATDYQLVEEPTAGTMRIQVAITHAADAWGPSARISQTSRQIRAAYAPWEFTGGRPGFEGEITIEFKVQDAHTLELLAAGIDRRVGGRTFKRDNTFFASWSDVKNSLEFWADQAVYRLCMLRAGTGCVEPRG